MPPGSIIDAARPMSMRLSIKAKLSDAERDCRRARGGEGRSVSVRHRPWVIGSDSVVSVDGRMFDKPADRDDAAEHLRFFSGKRWS